MHVLSGNHVLLIVFCFTNCWTVCALLKHLPILDCGVPWNSVLFFVYILYSCCWYPPAHWWSSAYVPCPSSYTAYLTPHRDVKETFSAEAITLYFLSTLIPRLSPGSLSFFGLKHKDRPALFFRKLHLVSLHPSGLQLQVTLCPKQACWSLSSLWFESLSSLTVTTVAAPLPLFHSRHPPSTLHVTTRIIDQ